MLKFIFLGLVSLPLSVSQNGPFYTTNDNVIKDKRNLSKPKKWSTHKETLEIFLYHKWRKNLLQTPIRVGDFYSNNYYEYEWTGNRNKTLTTEK